MKDSERSTTREPCGSLPLGPSFPPGVPSYPGDPLEELVERRQAEQTPHDCIDEASMESFPASDPPSHTTAHA